MNIIHFYFYNKNINTINYIKYWIVMDDIKFLTVYEFTKIIKANIENSYPLVYLKGEISNFRPSSTGHWYFSLKDEFASIKAIIFKNQQYSIMNSLSINNDFNLKDGQEVIVEGRISLYERSGEYSIIISKIIPLGIGELSVKFELLKEKLLKKGYFDESIKKNIPKYPSHIGIVTSSTAAALKDILNVLTRRFANIKITVFPASVQGENAKNEIAKAIKFADYHYKKNDKYKVDTLIIARGGGSIEDLWPFNEEIVAEAIYKSDIPIITGIGHEIDFTIADFCADLRAPTPSAAAELVVQNSEDLINSITSCKLRIEGSFNYLLDKLYSRLESCNKNKLIKSFDRLLQNKLQDFSYLEDKLQAVFTDFYKNLKQKFYLLVQKINDLSPLNTLSRGYSIVLNNKNKIVKSFKQVKLDEEIKIILNTGELKALVNNINNKSYFNNK